MSMALAAMWKRMDAVAKVLLSLIVLSTVLVASAPASAQTSPSGYTSGYRWDGARRMVGKISPSANSDGVSGPFLASRFTYNADGQLTKAEDGSLSAWIGQTTAPASWGANFTVFKTLEISYDAAGRPTKTLVRGSNNVIVSVTQISLNDRDQTICSAERMNPAIFASLPTDPCALGTPGSGTNDFGPDRVTKNIYNVAGQLVQVRKAVGTSVEQAYVTYGALNPATQQVEARYTPNGKQQYVVDANGNKAMFDYDRFDRQLKWIFPSTTRPTAFNPSTPANALATAGQLSTQDASPDDYEQYGYDPNGNRTSLRKRDNQVIGYYYDPGDRLSQKSGSTTAQVDYGYDLRGLQLSAKYASNAQGITSGYDKAGRLTGSTTTMGGWNRALAYQYDLNGKRTQLTYPDLQYMTYEYDGLNRMKAIKENGGTQTATLTYDTHGNRKTLDGGVLTTYGYDTADRLGSIDHNLGGTDTAYDVTYCMGALSGTCAPSYNPASQILKRMVSNDSYVWDGAYQVNRNYTTNGLNQYNIAGTRTLVYDLNGNLTNDGGTTYAYDSENRLLTASGSTNATLSYDPNGRLFQTTGSATTQLLYDGDALVGEYDGSGNLLRRYVHGPNVDEPLFWYEGSSLGTRRILRADHQGSIVAVADASGNKFKINSYDEYGIPASTNEGRFAYTGQIYLPDLKFYHYKARIYSPTLGRFLQTDPIGYKDQINLYAYVGNDPGNKMDPSGQKSIWGWVVERVKGGLKETRPLRDKADAVREIRKGNDVQAASKKDAVAAARAASEGKKDITVDQGHPLRDGSGATGSPHAHPDPRNGSHVFWDGGSIIIGAIAVLEVVGDTLDAVDRATNPLNDSGLSVCQDLYRCDSSGRERSPEEWAAARREAEEKFRRQREEQQRKK